MLEKPQILIGENFIPSVLPLISAAQKNIDIIIYDWRIYPNSPQHPVSILTQAFKSAAARGVVVRALVNSKMLRDYLLTLGIKSRTINSRKILHAKSILIDGRYSICGSHNFTQGGMVLNHEVSLAVDLGSVDNVLQKYFNYLYGI